MIHSLSDCDSFSVCEHANCNSELQVNIMSKSMSASIPIFLFILNHERNALQFIQFSVTLTVNNIVSGVAKTFKELHAANTVS